MLNRPEIEQVLRRRLTGVAVGGTFDEIKFGPIEVGEIHHIQSLAVENETTAITEIRVFVDGHGYAHFLYEQDSPVAATLYWIEDDFFLTEGETLVIRFTGCTAADKLAAYLQGTYIVPEQTKTGHEVS